jgi:hypothetical protein
LRKYELNSPRLGFHLPMSWIICSWKVSRHVVRILK